MRVGLDDLGDEPAYRAVIDASTGAESPGRAVRLVEPAGHVVLIGIAPGPSTVDTRDLVYADVTVTAVLGASAGLDGTIAAYASGQVVPDLLVAAVVGLADVAPVLAGRRPPGAGPGPKIQVDPQQRG